MPVNPTYPGLYIEELPSLSHSVTPAPTSITVFVGYAHPWQGECARNNRWGEAIEIFSFSEYERMFGGLFRSSFVDWSLPYAVNQFFLNGGSNAYVVALPPGIYNSTDLSQREDVRPASVTFNDIVFTSKQLTDMTSMTITIGSVRTVATPDDTADIVVSYGRIVETYRGVRLTSGAGAAFIDTMFADSQLVTVTPRPGLPYGTTFTSGATPRVLSAMPAPSYSSWTTFRPLDYDDVFKNDSSLDKVDIFNLLCLPGVADTGVWGNALAFCHGKRAFLILDPPANASADGGTGLSIESFVGSGNVPTAYPNAALYFPYLTSGDPITGTLIPLPPSGSVAGLYARTDTNRGVWKAPAGLETVIANTNGVVPEGRLTDLKQGKLNPKGVNVIRQFPGDSPVIWGARTTVTDTGGFEQWRYVPVRRFALFLEQSLLRSLGWVVFEPNSEPLWSAIRISIENFMLSLYRQNAFHGTTPNEAFLVKCDAETTTQNDIDLGRVNILVGFRPLKPAEFVIIKIAQLAGQAPG
jgi:phage tail sheath protein FI